MSSPNTIAKLLIGIKHFLIFRKPHISYYNFIYLIIDDKPLILFIWKIRSGFKIKIKGTKHVFWQKSSAAICLLPNNQNSVVIIASNLWRKKKLEIKLRHLTLDKKTTLFILNSIKSVNDKGEITWQTPLSSVSVLQFPIQIISNEIKRNKSIAIKNLSLRTTMKPVLQTNKFTYQK